MIALLLELHLYGYNIEKSFFTNDHFMMSEHKKVSLTTLGPKKVDKKEEKKEEKRSIRLNLTLTEPNKNGCPIFDYTALVKKEREKAEGSKKKERLNGTVPFPNEDEDVAQLAKHYEDKYSDRRYTYAELGAGYDESDSFIDNTDICEEELTNEEFKRYEGFYINKEKFESGSETEKKTKRRRRSTVQTDSESTSESRSKKKYKSNKTKTNKQTTSVPNGSKNFSDSSMTGSSSSSSDSESERSVKA